MISLLDLSPLGQPHPMKRWNAGGISLFLLTLLTGSAEAASFIVNDVSDVSDASPNNGVCATVGGTCTLRAAVEEANARPGEDTIHLPLGDFFPLFGDLDDPDSAFLITDPLVLEGEGRGLSVIRGNHDRRIFHVDVAGVEDTEGLCLRNLDIRGSTPHPDALGTTLDRGGAIWVENGHLQVESAAFKGNGITSTARMDIGGGAIAVEEGASASLVNGCVFQSNFLESDYISQGGAVFSLGSLVIDASELIDNFANADSVDLGGAYGGAVYAGGDADLSDTLFSGNFATVSAPLGGGRGGALYTAGDVWAMEVTLENNYADDAGGAVYAAGTVVLDTCSVRDNASAQGGGIYSAGSLTVLDSVIHGNAAVEAGGGLNVHYTPVPAYLENVTLSGNFAVTGTAIRNRDDLVLHQVTITDNIGMGVVKGAGIHSEPWVSTTTVSNSIITEYPNGSAADCNGTFTSLGHNLVGSTTTAPGASVCIGFTEPGDQAGTAASPIRSRLGPLQANGGATLNHKPGRNSPAVDAGDPALCAEADQRGQTRPRDGNGDGVSICDIGAVER